MKNTTKKQALKPSPAPLVDKVSHRIKSIRIEKGISQTEVAEKIGMERSNYNRMENRGEKLSLDLLGKIADSLGVSVIQLISDDNTSITGGSLEADQLRKRVDELEDRLRDKLFIIDTYSEAKLKLERRIEASLIEIGHRELGLGKPVEPSESLEDYHNDPDGLNWRYAYKLNWADFAKVTEHLFRTDRRYFIIITTLIEEKMIDHTKPFLQGFFMFGKIIESHYSGPMSILDHRRLADQLHVTEEELEIVLKKEFASIPPKKD